MAMAYGLWRIAYSLCDDVDVGAQDAPQEYVECTLSRDAQGCLCGNL